MGMKTRDEEMDRFLTFLKLFLGMGILWIFAIVAGFLGSEDLKKTGNKDEWPIQSLGNFHAFEGIYVFVVFVLQRSVLGKIIEAYKDQGPAPENYPLADRNA